MNTGAAKMSDRMEYAGKDVSEAIANACKELNVSQEQLKIEVLSAGSAGLFGLIGKKKSLISVALKHSGKGRKSTGRKFAGEKPQRPRKSGRRKPSQPREKSIPERHPAEITAVDLDNIKADLTKILDLMGFPSEVEVSNTDYKIHAHITGEHENDLAGTEGQTIDSIQYLMRKIISRRIKGKVMFSLDAGNYRENRRQELEERALELADEVRESGQTKSIPALNPAERRIVHMKLQDDSTIRSRSVGDGHFKKILIYLPGRGRKKRN